MRYENWMVVQRPHRYRVSRARLGEGSNCHRNSRMEERSGSRFSALNVEEVNEIRNYNNVEPHHNFLKEKQN